MNQFIYIPLTHMPILAASSSVVIHPATPMVGIGAGQAGIRNIRMRPYQASGLPQFTITEFTITGISFLNIED
jgi:hypothetical protein